jgi:hypothetical protein
MKTRLAPWLLIGGLLGGVLLTASLLAGLRQALGRREKSEAEVMPDEREYSRIRKVMGGALGSIDPDDFPEHLRPTPGLPGRDALRRSLTPIDRPAWQDIREDRDARG